MMSVLHSTLGAFDESADMFPELGNFATLADKRAASEVLDTEKVDDDTVADDSSDTSGDVSKDTVDPTDIINGNNGNRVIEDGTEQHDPTTTTTTTVVEMKGNITVETAGNNVENEEVDGNDDKGNPDDEESDEESDDDRPVVKKRKVSDEQLLLQKKNRNGMNQFLTLKAKLENFQENLGYESDYVVLLKNNFYKKIGQSGPTNITNEKIVVW